MATRRTEYPFLGASGYTPVGSVRSVDLVVIHDMEAPEGIDTAERVARYFATGAGGRKVSSHYCIDSNSVVQCVSENDVAWCAPGANHNGIHLEHAGYARQTKSEWLDKYGISMLYRSSKLTADICRDYSIPPVFVDAKGLRLGMRGITTHAEVSRAFKRSDHTDPGPEFPMYYYLLRVRDRMNVRPSESSDNYWTFVRWFLAEGEFKGLKPHSKAHRPVELRKRIPTLWWAKLGAYLLRRKGDV